MQELCRVWAKQRLNNRRAELDDMRQQRLLAAISKLRELGWGSELDRIAARKYEPLRQHSQLRLAKPLTDRAWLKIQNDVVACMEKIRNDRLRGGRRVVLGARLRTLQSVVSAARTAPPMRTITDEYKPGVHDLAIMPEVRELIDASDD
ncbi:hypothetical protein FOMPIDRAFT_38816, partial [Fomitopsis schrenkii]